MQNATRDQILTSLKNQLHVRMVEEEGARPGIRIDEIGPMTVYTVSFLGSDPEAKMAGRWYTHYVMERGGALRAYEHINDLVADMKYNLRYFSFFHTHFRSLIGSFVCVLVLIFLQWRGAEYEVLLAPFTALLGFLAGSTGNRDA